MEFDFFWSWKVMEFELPKRVWTLQKYFVSMNQWQPLAVSPGTSLTFVLGFLTKIPYRD